MDKEEQAKQKKILQERYAAGLKEIETRDSEIKVVPLNPFEMYKNE